MNPSRILPRRGIYLLGLASLLGACASTGEGSGAYSSTSGTYAADSAAQHGDYLEAARRYQEAAQGASPSAALELRLRAAESAVSGRDYTLATNLISQLPASQMSADQQLRGRIVSALTALANNDPGLALRWLPTDPGMVPSASRALDVRGRALFASGVTVGGTETLVQREAYLHDAASLAENRNNLWTLLQTAPLDGNTLSRAGASDTTTRGWIELANLVRRNAPASFYNTWRQRYPGHPGEARLTPAGPPAVQQQLAGLPPVAPAPVVGPAPVVAPLAAPVPAAPAATVISPVPPSLLVSPVQQVQPAAQGPVVVAGSGFTAMLLPQAGPLAAVADVLRAGYGAAAARAGNAAPPQSFDPAPANLPGIEQQVAAAGAGLIVGPLPKDSVAALSQLGTPPVPVLALNYLDASHPSPPGFYQFGLAPEDEARAAAEDAVNHGLRRALVLVQGGEWGARVAAAFQQRMIELGGTVVDSDRYSGSQESWADPVKRLLRYRAVDDRKEAAELRAKAEPGTDPQRRNDFDFIFLGARSQDHARLLWPLFRFYHAERTPIYATAAVNSGPGDRDVAGIRFCDAPWLLDNTGRFTAFRDEALSGRNQDTARIYALGADTFLLAQRLSQGGLRAGDRIPAATGNLTIGADGAVHRGLVCARLSFGPPQVLGGSGDDAAP